MHCNLTRVICILFLLSVLPFSTSLANYYEDISGGDIPTLHVNFDNCASFGGGSNADYSEFTATKVVNIECSQLSLVGGHVYRDNPEVNLHSCTPGINDTPAMCISAQDTCSYDSSSDKALRFDIMVVPGPDGLGSLDNISFQERAPEEFSFIEGPIGPNDYPTMFALKIHVDGLEVLSLENMATSRDWNLRSFDFEGLSHFLVSDTTIFNVSILPYCLIGNGASMRAWDIDELTITGGCYNIRGGTISTTSNDVLCSLDTESGRVDFDLTGELGDNFSWLLIDENREIIRIFSSPAFHFSNVPTGNYQIFHIAYADDVTGIARGNLIDGITGCFDISNGLSFMNMNVSGGELNVDGSVFTTICTAEDNTEDVIVELSGNLGAGQLYILTDSVNVIIDFQNSDTFNFAGVPSGVCLIYSVSFEGQIMNFSNGFNIADITGCYELSSPVAVIRNFADGGTINSQGLSSVEICNNENDGLVDMSIIGAAGDQSDWIITDEDGVIVLISNAIPLDVSSLPAGLYDIQHVSSSAAVSGITIGENIADLSGCFSVSNTVSLNIMIVNGGMLNLEDGSIQIEICADDGMSDEFGVVLLDAIGDSTAWVITDTTGIILGLPPGPTFDLEGAGEGICLLWNLSFNDMIQGLELGADSDSLEGCLALSNPIIINRLTGENCPDTCMVEGGFIDLFNNNLCVGDGEADIMDADVFGAIGPFSVFILTDTDSTIVSVIDTLPVDLDLLPEGSFNFWHLSSTDALVVDSTLVHINGIDLSCFDLSDPAGFNTIFNNAGLVNLMGGDTTINICVGDSIPDVLVFENSSAATNNYQYVVTDTLNVILALPDTNFVDFENSGTGVCLVYGVSYTGTSFLYNVGDTLELFPTSACYDISNNYIEVIRDNCNMTVNGGSISLVGGAVEYCPGDSTGMTMVDAFVFEVILNGAFGTDFNWVLIDSSNLIIDINSGSPPLTYDLQPPGTYTLYHMASEGIIDGLMIGSSIDSIMGSYALSNTITLNSAPCETEECLVDGGSLDLFTNNVCVSDGEADLVDGDVFNSIGDYSTFLITDIDSIIIGNPASLPINFESAGPGTCLVWHLAANDSIPISMGTHVNNIGGCYDLSSSQAVVRVENFGGMVSTSGVDVIEICVGDSIADVLEFMTTGIGQFYQYIVTDTFNVILGVPDSTIVDFENAGTGTCRVYGLAHNATYNQMPGDTLTVPSIPGSCFDLSENFVEVIRDDSRGPCDPPLPDLSIVLSRVGESSQIFDIKNIGSDTVDVSDYWICKGPGQYFRIGDIVLECGTFNTIMAPGDVNGLNIGVSNTDGELGLYNTDDFTNSDAIIHYVEWGSTGHPRSSVAVAAGLWTTGDFVPAITAGESIYYDEEGILSTDWEEGQTNLCGELPGPPKVVFNRVSDNAQIIDLKNISTDTVDVNDYFIQQGIDVYRIGDLMIECGPLNGVLMPDEIIGVVVIPMSNVDGELALYTSQGNFTFNVMSDYVQWGSAGHGGESSAVFNGIWSPGDFVATFSQPNSIYYDGEGDDAADWEEGTTNFCSGLKAKGDNEIEYSIFPNPAIDQISVDIRQIPEVNCVAEIYNSYGSKILSKEFMNINGNPLLIDLPNAQPGTYFLRIKSNSKVLTKKFLLVE